MNKSIPQIMFAALKSGSGKTTFTCGFIKALQDLGVKPRTFKCGPDYIDPMFHTRVLGVECRNLDSFFVDEEALAAIYMKNVGDSDITIVEGVMGYYDGLGGNTDTASSYEVASILNIPVILIVDAKGASVSLAAMIKGLINYRDNSHISGVILNRVSASYYPRIKEVIETECGIPVVGYMPEIKNVAFESRHLGLFSPDEICDFDEKLAVIAESIKENVDIDTILSMAQEGALTGFDTAENGLHNNRVTIAVARDEAFSFYYQENIDALERAGAQIKYFSPIHDEAIPEDADCLIFWGGYPENYAEQLAANHSMKASIRQAYKQKMPIVAECGGFMYLNRLIECKDGSEHLMCGILPGTCRPSGGLRRFGYMEVHFRHGGLWGSAPLSLRCHEFHHWDCDMCGTDAYAVKPGADNGFECMVYSDRIAAGFEHFYYPSNPEMVESLIKQSLIYRYTRKSLDIWDHIAKPIDSLGVLETYVSGICGVRQDENLPEELRKALVIFCADHGVVEEGVTQTDSGITRVVAENFVKDKSTVCFMAKQAKADIYTVNVGMKNAESGVETTTNYETHKLIDLPVMYGTGNLVEQEAMSMEQCLLAIETGREALRRLKLAGYDLIATGEMGIGNTTSTAVLTALLLGLEAEDVTGPGAGLDKESMVRKVSVVDKAVRRIRALGNLTPIQLLAQGGGLEIAAMVGGYLEAAKENIPVIIDGAISTVAALIAYNYDNRVRSILIPSHMSAEPTAAMIMDNLGLTPPLQAGMHLGEGSGAVAIMPIIDMAVSVYRNMGSFDDYGISEYVRYTC